MLFIFRNGVAQNVETENSTSFFIPEIFVGKTMEANEGFPKTNLQIGLLLSYGKYNNSNEKPWAVRLNHPKTGFSIGVFDFGNSEKIGRAYILMPFIEFGLLKQKTDKLNLNIGIGASYLDTLFDKDKNPLNKAVTTRLNWSFKSFVYYDIIKTENTDWRFGLGYSHYSNGHTRLPNQGLNSVLASFSAKFNSQQKTSITNEEADRTKTSQTYFSGRIGLGQNVLSEFSNDKKGVYSVAFSAGKVINSTFKFGGGFYYRFYKNYYDYIKNDGEIVVEDYPIFQKNPFGYASNFGLFVSGELLLSHIGFEFELGVNIYKPFYKVDWRLNKGYTFQNANDITIVIEGELDWYYEIKRTISSRMGLKYYLITNDKTPKHNFFVGAHINANLGQADFTELSFGYVYRLDLKRKN